jgi:hypothetical protein
MRGAPIVSIVLGMKRNAGALPVPNPKVVRAVPNPRVRRSECVMDLLETLGLAQYDPSKKAWWMWEQKIWIH